MKRGRILNRTLNDAIAAMGHGDWLMITDAGFPIPDDLRRIDLALEAGVPTIQQILEAVLSDFVYERYVVAEELKRFNPGLYGRLATIVDRCEPEFIPHAALIADYPPKVKFFVRSGDFEPWGNLLLCSGVDAPRWFKKDGIVVPDYYKSRVEYSGKA